MSLHVLANHMATKGRGPDSMLVHMTPAEVASLQALALKNGGSLTINPETGLPEAGFLKKLLPAIAGFALNAFLPGVGTAIGSALGTSAAVGTGIAVGGITGLATGSLSKGLMAGLGAYGGAGLADAFVGAGAASGLNSALANAGTAEGAQGQAFNEFLKSEANPAVMSSTDKLSAGFNAVKEAPGAFLKDNWKMGLAAASPFLADAMVPTTVKAPNAQSTGYIRPFQFDENTRTVKAMDPVLASEWGARQFPDYIRKSQTTPPAGLGQQLPPGMATGGIVALADGGETDPYAKYNTLSGQSKAAYDYLMGNIQRVPAADLTTPTRPVVSNTNTVPTTGGGGGDGSTGTTEPPTAFFPPTYTEPVLPSPDEDFPSTYPEPVMPSPDEDFPSTYPEPVMPSPDEDFPSTYPEPVMPSPDEDFPSTYIAPEPQPQPYVSDPYNPEPVYREPFVPEPYIPEPEPVREPVDASYWSNPGQDEVGPSRGLMKNQEELPEEFDKYLQPTPSDFIPADPRDFGGQNDAGYCPAPWINILLADGGTVKAGDIKPGMKVYTRHETTNEWGVYPVSAVEMSEDERWEVLLEDGRSFVGSANHRVHTGEDWTEIHALKAGDKLVQPEGFGVVKSSAKLDHGAVVKITVADAHTYISEGFLSHNVKLISPTISDIDYSDYNSYDWDGWANGGMVPGYAMGGLGALGGYSDGGRLLKGPGDGVSDSIPATIGRNKQPARLADGEFVVPARIVSELGNGSTEAGARKLYAMMDRIQKARGKTVGKGKVAANSRSDKHLPA